MSIQVQIRPQDPPLDIPVEDFDRLTRAGEIPPDALVWGKFLTGGEWRSADNLRRFHKNSPRPCPHGPILEEELRREAVERRRSERLAHLHREYSEGSLLEDRFGLPPLSSLAVAPGVVGAARLLVRPSFTPESVVTLIYRRDGLQVEGAKGSENLWYALAHLIHSAEAEGAPAEEALPPIEGWVRLRVEWSMSAPEARDAFLAWDDFLERARQADDFRGVMVDGTGYRHKVAASG